MRYAEVVVNVPIGTEPQTFHYRIPPDLIGRLAPGHLVAVPFGPRPAQGVVVALSDTSPLPEEAHKDVEGLVDETPVLTPAQIALARWIADYYRSSLLDALLLMLPPGLDQRATPSYRLPPNGIPLPDLSNAEQRLLSILGARAPLDRGQMDAALQETGLDHEALERLVRRRIVRRDWHLPGPSIGPQMERVARLIADKATIEATLPTLGRETDLARVLALLLDQGPQPLSAITTALRCTNAPIKTLAGRGLVKRSKLRDLVESMVTGSAAQEALAGPLKNAPQQAAALTYLLDHPEPQDRRMVQREAGISAYILGELEKRGLARRWTEEPVVSLSLSHVEATRTLAELRGAGGHLRVLDWLQRGPLEVGELRGETKASLDDLNELAGRGLIAIEEREVRRDPLAGRHIPLVEPPPLTPDQAQVWHVIEQGLRSPAPGAQSPAYLLHGVTGSGKTEVYLRALAEVVQQGRQAIVLVPEIALTPQTVHRFAARFPGRVAVLHSGLTPGQRYDEWRRARAGAVDVVVGARSAIYAPLPNLGLVVIDEEHEWSYKQDQTPRYHARDVALKLAELTEAIVILGSATPAVESYRRAERGQYHLLTLPQRIVARRDWANAERARYRRPVEDGLPGPTPLTIARELPPVQVVDMRAELKAGNRSIFSRPLDAALRQVLQAGEQAILFLNRRGAATFVLCRDCGHVLRCARCEVSLTYHESGGKVGDGGRTRAEGEGELICHHCNRRYAQPVRCPACGSPRIRYFGIGTQRVEAEVRAAYPQARVLRWDRDTARSGKTHERFLDAFARHQADILIGTQMVAKGLDLPLVTLVGVISADTALHLPDFRSTERTFQLLAQVAGRAGRSSLGGRAIVQTYSPDQYAIQAAARHDYAAFYRQEIAFRREQGYPPFGQLARLVYSHSRNERAEAEAQRMYDALHAWVRAQGLGAVTLIGPAPAYIHRLRGRYRWQIVIRAQDVHPALAGVEVGPGWSVDVDPAHLL
ncbi:MAG: primosomal protein N' [Chloroflexi bacterium]|nr:primosomal protein N' [Chloroflexota bacterium]MBU1747948.1 primosomal protein N' [Chloroflexota bacterium]